MTKYKRLKITNITIAVSFRQWRRYLLTSAYYAALNYPHLKLFITVVVLINIPDFLYGGPNVQTSKTYLVPFDIVSHKAM